MRPDSHFSLLAGVSRPLSSWCAPLRLLAVGLATAPLALAAGSALAAVPVTQVSSLAISADTGGSQTDLVTRIAAQAVAGTLDAPLAADERVELSIDDGASWVVVTAGAGDSTWSAPGVTLVGGGIFQARVANADGSSPPLIRPYTLDTMAPQIVAVAVPASATYHQDDLLDFAVAFGEPVGVEGAGGTPALSISIGAASRAARYLSGSGGRTLLFRYTVVAGDLDADGIAVGSLQTQGGSLRDLAGNDAILTLNNVGSTAGVLVNGGAGAPAAPVLASATPGDRQVTLAWTAPADNGSPLTGYTVSGMPSGGCSVPATATGCTVTGLTNGTPYTFTLTATNALGPSQASAPLGATPLAQAVPGDATAVPTLSHAGLALTSALLGLLAWRRRRPA